MTKADMDLKRYLWVLCSNGLTCQANDGLCFQHGVKSYVAE